MARFASAQAAAIRSQADLPVGLVGHRGHHSRLQLLPLTLDRRNALSGRNGPDAVQKCREASRHLR